MMLFIQANDLASKKEGNEEDRRSIQLNVKVMHTLFYALDPEEYCRISSCSNAKEIWDKLEVIHEGTNQVKK
ncbi:UBN2 domain-containing protein [Gossypium australe]|uniref:UBN2 domain-containing protein n=1 Tax=Gossypium australe TaxID=47621 RepID=A0A5B6WT13_9ROSI|nr:UBN2 domain-containing protein [Gossypium australe]